MNILIAPDSFKESLDAINVCDAIQSGFGHVFTDAHFTLLPIADGGEGTASTLAYVLDGSWKHIRVHDPLMRPILAKYLILPDATAVIEVAEACGLHLLSPDERNPMLTSTYGVGEMIVDALNEGVTQFIIGLGGSATNDAGLGMLSALGIKFYDANDHVIGQGGAQLAHLHRIDTSHIHPNIAHATFKVACDVTSPLCGPRGASAVFGPQKGATPQQVIELNKALANFATVAQSHNYSDNQWVSGAGAAGGLGFALKSFCDAMLESGFDIVAEVVQLQRHIEHADLIITGEGKLDSQSMMGKVVGGISHLAKANQTPVIAICGSIDRKDLQQNGIQTEDYFDVAMPCIQTIEPVELALDNAPIYIKKTAANIAAAIKLGQNLDYSM